MDPSEEIIIPEPFYANYNGFSVANGVNIIPIFSSIENNFKLPKIEDFENLITEKTKAICTTVSTRDFFACRIAMCMCP